MRIDMSKRILFIAEVMPELYDGSSCHLRDFFACLKEYDIELHLCALSRFRALFLKKIHLSEYYTSFSVFTWRRFKTYHYRLFPIQELILRLRKWLARHLSDRIDPDRKRINALKVFFGGKNAGRKMSGEELPKIDLVKTGQFIQKCCERIQPDILIFDYAHMLRFLPILPTAGKTTVVFTHDVMFLRKQSFQKQSISTGITQKTELDLLRLADCIVLVQGEENAIIRSLLPDKRCITCPVSAEIFPMYSRKRSIIKGKILFVGSGAEQNMISIRYFIQAILPAVRKAHPEVFLQIAGGVCSSLDDLRELPGLRLVGVVDNLSEEYTSADVCIVPLLAGSGLKIKLMEALAYGCKVFSTSVGVQGIPEYSDYGIEVTDNADEFSRKLIAWMDLENRPDLSEENALFKKRFSRKKCYGELLSYLQISE